MFLTGSIICPLFTHRLSLLPITLRIIVILSYHTKILPHLTVPVITYTLNSHKMLIINNSYIIFNIFLFIAPSFWRLFHVTPPTFPFYLYIRHFSSTYIFYISTLFHSQKKNTGQGLEQSYILLTVILKLLALDSTNQKVLLLSLVTFPDLALESLKLFLGIKPYKSLTDLVIKKFLI